MIDFQQLADAYQQATAALLQEQTPEGHWVGELANSALSTATAVAALAIVQRQQAVNSEGRFADESAEQQLSGLILGGLRWLADRQNPDGGWGDTDKSLSNIATSMLVRAAFHLTGVSANHADLLNRVDAYIHAGGDLAGLRQRYGKDKTFAVPILTMCALAEQVSWKEVSPLPFELACFPQGMFRFLKLPVVSYAIPALVAIGQARYFHRKPLNPIMRAIRGASVHKSLQVLEKMQPASGGFLEAAPLTSFVVMSLASIGRHDHPVVRQGVKFLIESAGPDGSWPIDTNLATWNTTLSLNALADGGEDVTQLDCLEWLLSCQHVETHPYTGAEPGGWAWTDLTGGVPDVDDTSGALLALSRWPTDHPQSKRINEAARAGIVWLLDVQNSDGGWPTFCRGWGTMPFDRSATDLTAHAIRAMHAWRSRLTLPTQARLLERIEAAIARGFRFLDSSQREDGSWAPLWFGNQYHPQEENPVYGTARVLSAYRDLEQLSSSAAGRGAQWLADHQNADGGWGGGPPPFAESATSGQGKNPSAVEVRSSMEETALAVESLLSLSGETKLQLAAERGVQFLIDAVSSGRWQETSPIGFYFAKLWYYERLYPLIFTVSALGQAARQSSLHSSQARAAQPLKV